MEPKKNFVSRFLFEIVHTLADIEFQKRVWVRAEGPEVDCFDETMNQFQDYLDSFRRNYQSQGLSKEEYEQILNLEKKCDSINYTGGRDEEIISQPVWQEVVESAKALSKRLKRFEDYE